MFRLARRVGRLSRRIHHPRDRRHKVQRAYRLLGHVSLMRWSGEARRLALAVQPASVHAGHMRAVNV